MDKSERAIQAFYHINNIIPRLERVKSTLTFAEFEKDTYTSMYVERLFSIIGEASVRIRDGGLGEYLPENKKIISFRNFIIHAYDIVDKGNMWDYMGSDLQILKRAVLEFVEAHPYDGDTSFLREDI